MKELKKSCFKPYSLNNIKPAGWYLNQLRIQAEGLSGNLDKFWNDIKDSKWIGGTTEGWERMPYWLDGFIPLAKLLNDDDMLSRAKKYIDAILARQKDDGWLCPTQNDNERGSYDMWALFLILKTLTVWHDATGDERIEPVVRRALLSLDRHIDGNLLFGWAQTRWFECLISIYWLYEREPEEWLISLAAKLRAQGFDWQALFTNWPYKKATEYGRWSQMNHVVNNAMMIKSSALWWKITGDEGDRDAAKSMMKQLDEGHGMATGMFTGDECLSGNSPVQGTELCAVAEYMYSLQHLIAVTGDPEWAERLESIAYNCLPATFSPDMWTHQYDQQVNQIECSRQENPIFRSNGPDANLFGLEPNYGCCTANLSQAWPKFAQSIFMEAEDGIAINVYAPAILSAEYNGSPLQIEIITDYPFREDVKIKVTGKSDNPLKLYLRKPAFVTDSFNSDTAALSMTDNGGYITVLHKCPGVEPIEFTLSFPMKPVLLERPENLYAVKRGPLVYSLKIGEKWEQINKDVQGHELPHGDFEVFAATPWNYGFAFNKNNIENEIKFEELPMSDLPFSPENAPVKAYIPVKKIKWVKERGAASRLPGKLLDGTEAETSEFIPYGCTNLRMTEMPVV